MNRILCVDCDLTVCPSDVGWSEWLQARTDGPKHYGEYLASVPYNLAELYCDVEDPLAYWRELDYNKFQPLKGSVEKLEVLSKYFEIVFVSAIKGQHTKSKYYWLQQHFPFMSAYVATKEKWVFNQDKTVALIDDRLDNLEGFDYNKRVLFKTNYEQSVDCPVAYTIEGWESFSVKDFCKEYID